MVLFIVLIVWCNSMGQSDRRTNKRLSKQVGVFFDVEYEKRFSCVRDFRFLVFIGAAVQRKQVMVHYKGARVCFPFFYASQTSSDLQHDGHIVHPTNLAVAATFQWDILSYTVYTILCFWERPNSGFEAVLPAWNSCTAISPRHGDTPQTLQHNSSCSQRISLCAFGILCKWSALSWNSLGCVAIYMDLTRATHDSSISLMKLMKRYHTNCLLFII